MAGGLQKKKEKYPSKAAKKKHEKAESPAKKKQERKLYGKS